MDRLPNELVHDVSSRLSLEDLRSMRYVDSLRRGYAVPLIDRERASSRAHDERLLEKLVLISPYYYESGIVSFHVLRAIMNAIGDDPTAGTSYRNTALSLIDNGLMTRDYGAITQNINGVLSDSFRYISRVEVRDAHTGKTIVFDARTPIGEILSESLSISPGRTFAGFLPSTSIRGTTLYLSSATYR